MKLRSVVIIGAAFAMAAMIQTAQASLTLDQFEAGGTLSEGGLTFTGVTPSTPPSGLTGLNLDVSVSESGGVVYLTYSGNLALGSTGPASADILLQYTVTGGPISMIDQSYVGSGQGGLLAIDETAATGGFAGTVVGYSHLQVGDFSDPPAEPLQGDTLIINPSQSLLYVTKDINFSITSTNGGLITISAVSQSYHPVPEISTVLAGALLLLPLGASTLRILRRNRMA